MPAQRELRILCLHGSVTNATVMSLQTSGFVQAFGDDAEFFEVDAPHLANRPPSEDILELFGDEEEYFEWWHSQDDSNSYDGHEKSIDYLQRYIANEGPFDAIIGFSQGAMMATVLTAHYLHQEKAVPYKAVILVSGMWPEDGMSVVPVNPDSGKQELDFPSFHVLGEQDFMYEDSKVQVEHYADSSRHVYTHAGGHRFPELPAHRDIYDSIVQHLKALCQDI
ncbi:Aste57867_13628 [Aphanomyces stellatus]|uniref:Aste57867_13628 protein n=1 Tax=Aphanomyces stellatus TaxID=120398 RepID=A0A485KZC4_9STRA|nr:hypothetical protein As57867_013578 [Aphanomyces stellatus]VFT90465.1 Aste57867_13628 [Aphanomyces stellatus]